MWTNVNFKIYSVNFKTHTNFGTSKSLVREMPIHACLLYSHSGASSISRVCRRRANPAREEKQARARQGEREIYRDRDIIKARGRVI